MTEAGAIMAGPPNTTEMTGGTIGAGSGMTEEGTQTDDPGTQQGKGERGWVGSPERLVIQGI